MTLFSIEPIGVGTQDAEGMPSYLHRLSIVHGVTIGQLLERVERLAGRSEAPYRKNPVLARFVRPNDTTRALVSDLEKATNQKDLAALTLLPISSCLARDMGCYTNDMRWCGGCLTEQVAAGGDAHYKLLWHFSDLRTCHFHGLPILRACPHCGKHQNTLRARVDAARCQKCRRSLLDKAKGNPVRTSTWKNDAFDLCRLVADLPGYLGLTLAPDAPRKFIDAVFDYYWFSQKEMELYSKVDQHEMLSIIHGDTPVTLRALRKFAFQLGVPIDRFLLGIDGPYEPLLNLQDTYRPPQITRNRRERHKHDEIFERISRILDEKRPGLSLRELAEGAGVSVGYLSNRLPDVASKVSEDRRTWLENEKARKRREALAKAFEYFTRDERLFVKSRKQALRVLMKETGLPKNVLRDAIKVAYEKASVAI